jgi:choice-of-anchor B domain-containing protein
MNRVFLRLALPLVMVLLAAPLANAQSVYADYQPVVAGFGGAVAVGNGFVAFGETNNEDAAGSVHVYTQQDGAWAEAFTIDGPSDEIDRFGRSLDADGNLLIVGATSANAGDGAAYIYEVVGGQAALVATLSSMDDAGHESSFGRAVAISGDRAVVSAAGADSSRGAVFVFQKDRRGNWSATQRLQPSTMSADDMFGLALDLDGGLLAVGAPQANGRSGNVSIYTVQGRRGEFVALPQLTPDEATQWLMYGSAIAVSSADGQSLVAVGTPGLNRGMGQAQVFAVSGNRVENVGSFVAPDSTANARFGMSVAIDGSNLYVGAPGMDGFDGRVFAYRMTDGAFAATDEQIAPAETGAQFLFGMPLSVSGSLAAIGATGADFRAGAGFIYERNAAGSWSPVFQASLPIIGLDPIAGERLRCAEGEVAGFTCQGIDLLSLIPTADLGGARGVQLNDIWGWTDPETNREYAIVGRMDGTAFVDVTDALNPRYLGNLPKTAESPVSTWRDIKVYANHAYIVADGAGNHGMQVFDLTRLRGLTGESPETFDVDFHYDRIASAHNVVVNEDTGFIYAVGSSSGGETCGGGLHMIDVRSPKEPTFAGCFSHRETGRAGTGYTHDAQCVVYRGPDPDYQGQEICFSANETALSIGDVTVKDSTVAISQAAYPNVAYAHQGWLTEDQRYFYLNDELDEMGGNVSTTRTLVWDVSDLDDPTLVKEHLSNEPAIDHNLYVRDNLMYQSNYVAGLRLLDVSDPENPEEIGFFDTVPDSPNTITFGGSWSNYPYFASGIIVVTSMEEGLFILKKSDVDL